MVEDTVGDEQMHSLGGNLVQTVGDAAWKHLHKTGSHITRFYVGVEVRARSSIQLFLLLRRCIVWGFIFLSMTRFVEDVTKDRPNCLSHTWKLSCPSTICSEAHTFSAQSFDSFLTNQCMMYVRMHF